MTSTPAIYTQPPSPDNTVQLVELVNLTQNVAELNADYLTVSVTIILFLGGIFYLFNFKPLQDKLQKQEQEIEDERKENKLQLKKLEENVIDLKNEAMTQITSLKESLLQELQQKNDDLDTKIQEIEKNAGTQISALKFEAHLAELLDLWERHHLWQLGSLVVSENSLRLLIEYLEKSFKYDIVASESDLLVRNIKDVLKAIGKETTNAEGVIARKKLHERLIEAISYKQFFNDDQREEIKNLATEVLLTQKT